MDPIKELGEFVDKYFGDSIRFGQSEVIVKTTLYLPDGRSFTGKGEKRKAAREQAAKKTLKQLHKELNKQK